MDKLIIKYKGNYYRVDMSKDNTKIYNSHKITCHLDMIKFLKILRIKYPQHELAIRKRSLYGMLVEWKAHNLLYYLGILRSQTADVDLNIKQKWYIKIAYFILSLMYLK